MKKTRLLLIVGLVLLFLTLAACGGPPETQVYIVVTSTHQPPTLTAMALMGTPTPVGTADLTGAATPTPTLTTVPDDGAPDLTATPDPRPTTVLTQIQVAEQVFEGGRMFWLQPTREIWVLINDPGTTTQGTWQIYEDTFIEGEAEIDPELTPPVDGIQPRRGFGKLWREETGLRDALGWGTTPEFGFVTPYEYRAGGYLDSDGQWVSGPGTHILTSLGNEVFAFDEANMTWQLVE